MRCPCADEVFPLTYAFMLLILLPNYVVSVSRCIRNEEALPLSLLAILGDTTQ